MDRLFFWLCLTGTVILAFIAGAVSLHYKFVLTQPVGNAITAAEALHERWTRPEYMETPDAAALHLKSVDDTVKNAKVYWDKKKAYDGYTLFTLRYSTSAYLVDMDGKLVYRWDIPFEKAFPNPTHINSLTKGKVYLDKAHLFPNGDLLLIYESYGDTPYGYGIAKVDKHSNILWTYNGKAHHDFYMDKHNGNIYALTQEFIKKPVPGTEQLPYPILSDFVVTLSPEGKELDKIPLLEAFQASPYALMMYHRTVERGRAWDVFHTNSVMKLEPEMAEAFPMFKPGQLLLSIRNMDAIAVLDPQTRKIIWAFNGIWKEQHAARFTTNGTILVYDNKGHVLNSRPASRIVEFDPKTLGAVWHYAGNPKQPFYSRVYGRLERLPNGNTLFPEPTMARIFEVTSEGEIVWSYSLPLLRLNNMPFNWVISIHKYSANEIPFIRIQP